MSDVTSRLNAALHGRYRIERRLGEGGMATVYLARDARHDRNVALKVLKPELAAIVGAERFLAEIKTTANLQHPHILPLHDSGNADGFLFYVMPYVEGETLRDRLDREHQLPVDEAVRIAVAVAHALDHAHRHGVVHRDIKPANILLQDGEPVVADFGIALAITSGGAGRLTETGLSLGTPHYMSPEQATGDANVQAATDVWALGCVLYEMLAGEPPYTGSTPQAVLGKIITAEPASVLEARKSVPPHVEAAIRKALEKVPADRFATAGAFAHALGDREFRHGGEVAAATGGSVTRWRRSTAVFAALSAVLAVVAGWALSRGEQETVARRVTLTLTPPQGVDINQNWGLTHSPDGRTVVYFDAGSRRLFRRDLAEPTSVPIAGTESSWKPFFSPDGAWVGFFDDTNNLLKRVRLDGTGAQTLADAPATARSGVWREDGTIVFMSRGLGGLSSIPESGGAIEPLTREVDPVTGQVGDPNGPFWFDLLPSGTVAVGQRNVDGQVHIAAVDLATEEVKVLFPGLSPRFVRGHLVYGVDDEALWAVPFDVEALQVTGAPVRIADGVDVRPNDRAIFAITDDVLVYAPPESGGTIPVWIDREGTREPLGLEPGAYHSPKISPDGRRVALTMNEQGNRDILVYDIDSRVSTRITFEASWDGIPVWTPDGSRIVFRSERDHPDAIGNLYVRRADGVGDLVRLTESPTNQIPHGISADGSLIYAEEGDLWSLSLDAGAEPVRLTQSAAVEIQSAVAPNGRFLALQSNEQGPREVFVRSFPDFAGTWMVSTLDIALISGTVNADVRDAWTPVWSPTGRELYYQSGSTIVAVPVQIEGTFANAAPRVLFDNGALPNPATGPQFDVSRDGQRFLVLEFVAGGRNELIVVQNWADVLEDAGRD